MNQKELLIMSTKEVERVTAIQRVIDKKITQAVASQQLGLTVRQIKRLVRQYKQAGPSGLVSKQRGQPSNRKFTAQETKLIKALVETHYYDFGPKFASEKLCESHSITVSKETLRQWMIEWGLWQAKRKKQVQLHPLRDRRPCFGELVQIDGSPHDWFEGRGPACCLLVAIDDATSRLCSLHFEPSETTAGYFKLMRKYIDIYGLPLATYNDRHGIFRINLPNASEESETQFGRAMRQLGVEIICAKTPEAKGRVERANQTLQDRLIKEMRLLGICDIESANAYLPSYIAKHNALFAVDPLNEADVHCKELPTPDVLDLIFSFHEERKLTKNLELSYNNMIYQIKTNTKGYRLRYATVTVCEDLNGVVTLVCHGKILDYTCHIRAKHNPDIVDAKQLALKVESIKPERKPFKPAPDHPWRHFVIDPAKAAIRAMHRG